MRRSAAVTLALLASALVVPLHDLAAQGTARGPRAAIEATTKRHLDAYNKGDVAGFARVFSEDATVLVPNGAPVRGRPAIQALFQGGWDAGMRNLRQTTVELYVHGDMATEVGTYVHDLLTPKGMVADADRGKFIVLWKRDAGGQWKWYRDIYNSDHPPEGAAR